MARAFEELFGIPDAFRGVQMAGRTDTWILHDALAAHGVPPDDPRVQAYTDVYLRHLPREIANTPPGPRNRIMPGIRDLLDALSTRDDVYLALLTGNYETAARLKLEHFDLWRYFACGAYGDTPDRNSLFSVAVDRIIARGGPAFAPEQAVVIGDTPHDVGVALESGARSIGVATGSHTADDLRRAGADVVFEDLSDTLAVLGSIAGELS